MTWFYQLLSADEFVRRGGCPGWTELLVWLHNGADLATGLAYAVIGVLMVGFIRKRHRSDLRYMFWLFGAFIWACGLTHFSGVLMWLHPALRLDAAIKIACAIISVLTACLLIPLTPRVMRAPSAERLAQLNSLLLREVKTLQDRVYATAQRDTARAIKDLEEVIAKIQAEE